MKISDLSIGQKFITKLSRRKGRVITIEGFGKDNSSERRGTTTSITGEERYIICFSDGETKDVHPDVQVDLL